jgi:hypothetical protein
MNKREELKVLGRFYGKSVYGNYDVIKSLGYLNSVYDWKFLQFKGEVEVDAPSPHECRIKLPNGIQFYLVKRRRTWFDHDWILLYADENGF